MTFALRPSVREKIWAMVVLFLLGLCSASIIAILAEREILLGEKKHTVRRLVEVAHSIAAHYAAQEQRGDLSTAAAQDAAKQTIRAMRYDENAYFWINDLSLPVPRMVMHPTAPELDGQPLDDDSLGYASSLQLGTDGPKTNLIPPQKLFVALANVAQQGGHGYITYYWPKPLPGSASTTVRYPKLSYVKAFEPWGWSIGSGSYLDDVDALIHAQIARKLWLILGIGLPLIVLAALLARNIIGPLVRSSRALAAMTQGSQPMAPLVVEREDEIGTLIHGFNQLQTTLHRSEARFRSVVENAGDAIYIHDRFGWIHDVNQIASEQTGYSRAELLAASVRLLDTHSDFDSLCSLWGIAATEPERYPMTVESAHRRKDGTVFPIEVRISVLPGDDQGLRFVAMVRDITRRKQAEAALLEKTRALARTNAKLEQLATVFSHAREGVMITAPDGTILDVNEAFTRITTYSRDEALGHTPRLLKSGHQPREFYEAMWNALLQDGHWSGEVWNRRKDGSLYAELLTISAVREPDGRTQHFVALFTDISAQKAHQQQLEYIARYDALTGLPNRMLLADRLHQAITQARRRGQPLAVAYIDLDGFKAVNDTHGHAAGDQLLTTLARRMRRSLREGDTIARLGGDEFVAVLADLPDRETGMTLVERLLQAATEVVHHAGHPLQVSASIGVAYHLPGNEHDADLLLRQADQAMYQAKQAGKNRAQVFTADNSTGNGTRASNGSASSM